LFFLCRRLQAEEKNNSPLCALFLERSPAERDASSGGKIKQSKYALANTQLCLNKKEFNSQRKEVEMVFILFTSCPLEYVEQSGKQMMELPRMPDYIKLKGHYSKVVKGEGAQSISILGFENSKMADVYEVISDNMGTFSNIPGFTYTIEVWDRTLDILKKAGIA
jgi:hypothetical protein